MLEKRDRETVEALLADDGFVAIAKAVSTSSNELSKAMALVHTFPVFSSRGISDHELREILNDARDDCEIYDALNTWVGSRWQCDGDLPEILKFWVKSILFGKVVRPTKRTRKRAIFGSMRNEFLTWLVRIASTHGYAPTRNEASASTSASDIVVAALSKLGINLSYSVVARAWWTARPLDDDVQSETLE